MEVNFFGLTETTRACLPLLREGRDAGDYEHLVDCGQARPAGAQ